MLFVQLIDMFSDAVGEFIQLLQLTPTPDALSHQTNHKTAASFHHNYS